MSNTFTSRPAVTRGGRGRGTANTMQGNVRNTRPSGQSTSRINPITGQPGDDENLGTGGPETSTQQTEEQRMTYMGGYTKIPPNQKKRAEVTEMARRETEAYEQHKQQLRQQQTFNYVGTVGGGDTSLPEARNRFVRENPTKAQRLLKEQQRQSETRKREDEEFGKKKAEQRRKAEMGEQKARENEKLQEQKWDGHKKKTNEAWLNRLQREAAKNTPGSTSSKSGPGKHITPGSTSSKSGPAIGATDMKFRVASSTSQSADTTEYGAMEDRNSLTRDQQMKLKMLQDMFPNIPQESLKDILNQTEFDIEEAISLLT